MITIATTYNQTTPAALGVLLRGSLNRRDGGQHNEVTTMKERWKTFANGNYEASNLGRVRRKTPGRRTKPGRLMKLTLMTIGYYQVGPTINGKNVRMYVHHIVAGLFLGTCPDGCEVNHKDGDKTNNIVSNLEYVSHRDNMRHARRLNLINDRCTIPESVVREIRKLRADGRSYSQIASATGVSIGHCYNIVDKTTRGNV